MAENNQYIHAQIAEIKIKIISLEHEVEKLNKAMEETLNDRKDIYQMFEGRRIELTKEIKEIYNKINEIDSQDFVEMKKALDQISNLKWMFYGVIFILGWLFSSMEVKDFLELFH